MRVYSNTPTVANDENENDAIVGGTAVAAGELPYVVTANTALLSFA